MRSSSGAYYAGLDHIRALAAFLVIVWHFSHWTSGTPVPFNQAPALGPFDEGHLGVAVFMTLSGYLFAKLIGDRQILFLPFLWNRFVRLAPLLLVVLAADVILYDLSWPVVDYWFSNGAIFPILPHGAWSITIEAQFYVLLPLLLLALRRSWKAVTLLICAAVAVRASLFFTGFDIQNIAFKTMIGRFDQFALGMAGFYAGKSITGRIAAIALATLWISYALFDGLGGYYHFPYAAVWVLLPTLEGLCLAVMIAWYDRHPLKRGMWAVQKAGEYSYSIYLLHFFFVAQAAKQINERVMHISTLYQALPWAVLFFVCMTLVGHLSWILVERPFLRFRRPYIVDECAARSLPIQASA